MNSLFNVQVFLLQQMYELHNTLRKIIKFQCPKPITTFSRSWSTDKHKSYFYGFSIFIVKSYQREWGNPHILVTFCFLLSIVFLLGTCSFFIIEKHSSCSCHMILYGLLFQVQIQKECVQI